MPDVSAAELGDGQGVLGNGVLGNWVSANWLARERRCGERRVRERRRRKLETPDARDPAMGDRIWRPTSGKPDVDSTGTWPTECTRWMRKTSAAEQTLGSTPHRELGGAPSRGSFRTGWRDPFVSDESSRRMVWRWALRLEALGLVFLRVWDRVAASTTCSPAGSSWQTTPEGRSGQETPRVAAILEIATWQGSKPSRE